jgi:hypothetical protein
MVMNLFRKPELIIETDEATPSTPFRICTFRVTGRKANPELARKVRAALQMAVPGCECQELPPADVREASKMGARFRLQYYGQQVPGDKIKKTVEQALR